MSSYINCFLFIMLSKSSICHHRCTIRVYKCPILLYTCRISVTNNDGVVRPDPAPNCNTRSVLCKIDNDIVGRRDDISGPVYIMNLSTQLYMWCVYGAVAYLRFFRRCSRPLTFFCILNFSNSNNSMSYNYGILPSIRTIKILDLYDYRIRC